MARVRIVAVSLLLAGALTLSGCKKNKPPLPPPQAQAPTINIPEPEPLPPPAEKAAEPAEESKPAPEVTKPKPKTHIARKAKRKQEQPTRIIVEDGGTAAAEANVPPPHLVANTSADAAQRGRQTESLLNSSQHDVASLHRQLSNEEQAIVRHINSYVDQSRQALKEGDVDRAYNLALKAHLLSDSLKK
ncbi:MAG: hypothetical protein ACRD3E_13755 [Terriglobales bacterium]